MFAAWKTCDDTCHIGKSRCRVLRIKTFDDLAPLVSIAITQKGSFDKDVFCPYVCLASLSAVDGDRIFRGAS